MSGRSVTDGDSPILEMLGITVQYSGQLALDAVDLRLFRGEVHSLIGENGAGKSTLVKALTGAQPIQAGTIRLAGREVSFASPREAAAAGIGTVYQELNLLPNLSVAENILLGREPRHRLGIDWGRTEEVARAILGRLRVDIDPATLLGDHGPAIRQLVAIARAVSMEPQVLVLDEPTSSLDRDEVAELFRVIRFLKDSGVAILFISHVLEQVYELADRLTVLRNGSLVGEFPTHAILKRDLVGKMLGRDLQALGALGVADRDGEPVTGERPLLSARGLAGEPAIGPFDLDVFEGEVIGLAGLLGAGRSEVTRLISGVDTSTGGELAVEGRPRRFGSPRAAIDAGIVYSSEDRREEGIIADLSVRDNIVLALQAQRGWFRRIPRSRQEELASSYIEALRIWPTDPETKAGALSGGNQQKVLLARWLALAPRILVLDEPTRGIDVGAKVEIQRLVASLVDNGLSVLYVSAELDEVLRLSDRVLVLRDRRIVAVVPGADLTRDALLALIASGTETP